jgi:hypothetical protein
MKGAILEKGEKYYTNLSNVFSAIENAQRNYNWLITDCECYPNSPQINELLFKEYCWLSGDELTKIVEEENFQWIWAVLSGFEKNIPLDKVLKYELPYADGYSGFWKNPITLQHPLASVEIVPWDSSLTLLISKDEKAVIDFMNAFPLSEDLSSYNAK